MYRQRVIHYFNSLWYIPHRNSIAGFMRGTRYVTLCVCSYEFDPKFERKWLKKKEATAAAAAAAAASSATTLIYSDDQHLSSIIFFAEIAWLFCNAHGLFTASTSMKNHALVYVPLIELLQLHLLCSILYVIMHNVYCVVIWFTLFASLPFSAFHERFNTLITLEQ